MRIVRYDFKRSMQTVIKYFHEVLTAVLKLHTMFPVTPVPIGDDCTNPRWKFFKGCLGALDGTYIKVKVSESDKGRYRKKGVLCDAINRAHGLKFPHGNYYLCDNGYANGDGFLTPIQRCTVPFVCLRLEYFVHVYDDEVHENGVTDLELDYVMDDYIFDDPDDDDRSDDDIQVLKMFSVTIPDSPAYNYNPARLGHLTSESTDFV
ncbi:hypothetical protein BUALT_Bualt06G0035800 [Buddleja alternifolia]|uniref:Transposase n=1 Tax=Buddleja alternifolia TaxID=168488 RepID=A0AAV6XCQ2_9LAMI|nr:hypothetical protein BUALT_Bualt06G0035800 [Buddleja alternifolia]